MAKRKKQHRVKRATLIVVGEGAHEKAFLNHMKKLYDGETGQAVKIDSADGGSPGNIIQTTNRKYKHADYDRRFILMDADVAIQQQVRDKARKFKIELIVSTPVCLEGMLLEVLGQRSPDTNDACKKSLHPSLSGPPTRRDSYAKLFPKQVLDDTQKEQIVLLRKTISNH